MAAATKKWLIGRRYGNTVGGGCTSLGKYRIGYSYNGKFGLAFKLYGLDKTNDNAFARFVVLHAHDCVPETEVTDDICQSDGCPTVAPGFLQQLKPVIDHSKKPVLLWIFE
ncbi:MAG: murein L,D-transpeptidase catalytic domain-containing protein [Bacteroidota bacterium]